MGTAMGGKGCLRDSGRDPTGGDGSGGVPGASAIADATIAKAPLAISWVLRCDRRSGERAKGGCRRPRPQRIVWERSTRAPSERRRTCGNLPPLPPHRQRPRPFQPRWRM